MTATQGLLPDNVALTVMKNLQDQHEWTTLEFSRVPGSSRALIRGMPPRLLYLHPDDQIAALTNEESTGERLPRAPAQEVVLPVHLSEKWSLANFAAVFDSLEKTDTREKRIVLATLHNDSTVVYYIMQEGMVKPRQN
jgi:tRNA-splicing endonuclease subunit Sen15